MQKEFFKRLWCKFIWFRSCPPIGGMLTLSKYSLISETVLSNIFPTAQLPLLHVATNTSKHNIDMCQRQATIKIH